MVPAVVPDTTAIVPLTVASLGQRLDDQDLFGEALPGHEPDNYFVANGQIGEGGPLAELAKGIEIIWQYTLGRSATLALFVLLEELARMPGSLGGNARGTWKYLVSPSTSTVGCVWLPDWTTNELAVLLSTFPPMTFAAALAFALGVVFLVRLTPYRSDQRQDRRPAVPAVRS